MNPDLEARTVKDFEGLSDYDIKIKVKHWSLFVTLFW